MNRILKKVSAAVSRYIAAAVLIAFVCGTAHAKMSVLDSPHNLSASGSFNAFYFGEEERVCIFCHAPHNAAPNTLLGSIPSPLWNHELSSATYQPYRSTTLNSKVPTAPTGASRLCLSCHDGTIALNNYGGSQVTGNILLPPGQPSNLTTNLSDDHPISFAYNDTLAGLKKGDLAFPETISTVTKLDESGSLQCTTCHDPHDDEFGKFLVMDNTPTGSPLCITCHTYTANASNRGWAGSAHYAVTGSDSATGCLNCHQTHTAPQPQRLLRYVTAEDNCFLNCHNAEPKNLVTPFNQIYRHPVQLSSFVHDEAETLPAVTYHVECVDCHNPHRAAAPAVVPPAAPNVDGPLYGVRIDIQGNIAVNEFDVCFKCHAGTNAYKFSGVTNTPPNRMIADYNQANRFNFQNPSIHPVTTTRTTSKGSQSLITSMSRIYCSDCHGSDQSVKAGPGQTGANGPHGSRYEHILIAEYDMPPINQYPYKGNDASFYALCYRCHQQSFIMSSASGFTNNGTSLHQTHVQNQGVPCYVCHDPHGVPQFPSSGPGGTTTNNAHLINFNKDYAGPSAQYETLAPGTGSCTVSCHSGNNYTPQVAAATSRSLLLQNNSVRVKRSYSH
ncbi:MAG: cytochrome c3 family protein [Oryzomonas sp.]|uniref:cytochrome c3 family protein n=1 Tax=Oryzomonas sp. TaxID=2855186 RepID=UPI00284443C0|nr:cytochrome c3 family protein [Oryzomonas sp.]MDR3578333.1 cytochrome c3 family protein [Oryzomonas sp.]